MSVTIQIFTTGGTIDKVYFDENSEFQVGDPQIGDVLERSDVGFRYAVQTLFRKDSLHLTDEDRQLIRAAVVATPHRHVIVTHGTDTMVKTARTLMGIPDKVIVLTGSLTPAQFYRSHAIFNIGSAVAAVQVMSPGVYVVMNGRIFDAAHVRKNLDRRRFEDA